MTMLSARSSLLAGVVFAAGILGLADAALAAQTGLRCGDVVTHDVRLTRDLVGCPAAGLVVGAHGVKIDLAGHSLRGTRSGNAGIDDFAGYDGTTVVGGTLRDFTFGIALSGGARHNRVSDVSISGADGAGVLAVETTDNRIQADTFSAVNTGIEIYGASRNRVERNTITGTTGAGVEVDAASADNVIADNRILQTADVGIIVAVFDEDPTTPPEFPIRNLVTGNTLQANSFGILLVEANDGVVLRNTITGAGTFGDPSSPGAGIGLDGGNDNLLAANIVTRSRGDGIQIGADPQNEPHPLPPTGNRLAANIADANGRDGIRVNAIARETALAHNAAERNAAFGINAIAPVFDLGGNTAAGNAQASQCTGIECRPTRRR